MSVHHLTSRRACTRTGPQVGTSARRGTTTRTGAQRAVRAGLVSAVLLTTLAAVPPANAETGAMIEPVNSSSVRGVTSQVWRGCPSVRESHAGIDIAAPTGNSVVAAYDGTVTLKQDADGYGYYIDIDHRGGYVTRYAHLSKRVVSNGATVKKGQKIGEVGSTGRSTGPHLHFEVRKDGYPQSGINAHFPCDKVTQIGRAINWSFPGLPKDTAIPAPDGPHQFYLRDATTAGIPDYTPYDFARLQDQPLTGDWTGAGPETAGAFRNGEWFLRYSHSSGASDIETAFGRAGDEALVGDWDKNGRTDIGVRRGNQFYLSGSIDRPWAAFQFAFGRDDDEVVMGDWDGNGTDTPALVRGNEWIFSNDYAGTVAFTKSFGSSSDQFVAGDWNGDRRDTIGVYRPGTRTWHLTNTFDATGLIDPFGYGSATDVALTGDWDGNGTDTIGIVRPKP